MSDEKPEQYKRWHDEQGELSTLMELLDTIPEQIRPLITQALTERANQDFGEILGSLKSLGKDKIMALHQAAKKRRSYDQDPNLHQIANTFMAMPEAHRRGFAAHFLEFTSLMVDYLATCDTFGLEPQEVELRKMRDLFVDTGADAVRDFLHEIHQPYHEMELKESSVVLTEEGMRLKEI
ncbi:MAG TPA: hypothetical protein V6C52_02375 [Coleofasciculaceae cyanobacterium]|jgi:hypothetical protein